MSAESSKVLRKKFFLYPLGPKSFRLLGYLPRFRRDEINYLNNIYKQYGELVSLPFLGKRQIAVFGADYVRKILLAPEAEVYKTALAGFRLLTSTFGGKGILNTIGAEHAQHRKILQNAFSNQYLKRYQSVMAEVAANSLTTWRVGSEIDIVPEIRKITKKIAIGYLFGTELIDKKNEFISAMDSITAILDVPVKTVLSSIIPYDIPLISAGGTVSKLLSIINNWLTSHITTIKGDKGSSLAQCIYMARDVNEKWDINTVRDNLIQLYMTGYETTSCSIIWTLYLLAQHPHVCRKLLKELYTKTSSDHPSLDELEQMNYLDMVVKESLRLYPTGLYGYRKSAVEMVLGKHCFPPDTIFLYSPWITHHIPALFPDPYTFSPERFQGDDKLMKGSYLPFGMGSRACLGMRFSLIQIKTVVSAILKCFRLDILPNQHIGMTIRQGIQLVPGLKVLISKQDGQTEKSKATIYGKVVAGTTYNS